MLLIKFGKKEHLEQLKNGIIHFSKLEAFQSDPTTFRGDRMEGRNYLDPQYPLLVNGVDISPFIKEAIISYEAECNILSFSASMLSKKNCHRLLSGLYTINSDYVAEMKQFGDYYLIFNAFEFIESLKNEFSNVGCGFEYHPIVYIDKHNYNKMQEYYDGLPAKRKQTGHLFVKDTSNSYTLQNEWRMIVFDIQNHYSLDNGRGANIKTGFSTSMPILYTDSLNTLQCSEEFLFD